MPEIPQRRKRRRSWKRLFRRPWFVVLAAGVVLAVGFYVFTGWRARDLAGKARENFEKGNYRMAWLQLRSARELRASDSEVLRTGALLEAKFGRPEALATWQELESRGGLREEDLDDKVQMAMRFGSDKEFEEAVRKLEASGASDEASGLRASRAALRGDLDRAIDEARRAVRKTENPTARLELARLLGQRHGHVLRNYGRPAAEDLPALQEVVRIIDGLQGSELAEAALALGLGSAVADNRTKKRWAEAAITNVAPSNPALLPAAEFLVRSGSTSAEEMQRRLRPVYDTASVAQRAELALWLSRQGLPKEGLGLVTAQEAADNLSAFLARTDAMARLANWRGVLEATETAEKVPDSMRQLTRVWALVNLDNGLAMGPAVTQAVEAAVQAAAREKTLRPMLESLEVIGAGTAADGKLSQLCADPEVANTAFALLRERVGRTGGTDALETAYARALKAAPGGHSVQDHGRYLELFRSLRLESTDTAAAIVSRPSDVAPRVTHALLMLRRNDPAAAKATFDDLTVFFDQLLPAQQVVVAAFTAGTGDKALAGKMRGAIDKKVLTPGETALLDQWVPLEDDAAHHP